MPTIEPFDFVPYPSGNAIDYTKATGHDHFQGCSGRLECELEALSPFLVMDSELRDGSSQNSAVQFKKNRSGTYVVPGTSLKGLVRSVFEVLYPSCTRISGGKTKVPSAFRPCRSHHKVCPACRVFGFLNGGTVLKGKVNIGTAHAVGTPELGTDRQLIGLFRPHPEEAKYNRNGHAKGYKFYFHQQEVKTANQDNDKKFGTWITPLKPGTCFTFSVTFENLTDRELNALVAALVLTDRATDPETGDTVAVRHKLGYGKPAGLGSVAIRLTDVELQSNARKAYTSFDRSPRVLQEGSSELKKWIAKRQQLVFGDPSRAVQHLTRILRYPPREDVTYAYDKGAFG
ncbi:RAMP superfamily CRISPR-associated protein [Salisaeta longa]|uniref:RAMP superfamily CRISPR-associated protein n=1 Tax=Salisaeta longa TaxID=503170 RepID=UPI000A07125A|nr:RAMP superfamily CRISPR-associated protein [Salisaeta longa]